MNASLTQKLFFMDANPSMLIVLFLAESSLRSANVLSLWVCGSVGLSALCSKAPKNPQAPPKQPPSNPKAPPKHTPGALQAPHKQ